MRKIKGFTIIELLAVIVILAIIALIAIPVIMGIIENVRKDAYKASLREIFNATEFYIATNEFGSFPSEGINITDPIIEMKNKAFTSGKIIKNEHGQLALDKISNGEYCAGGTIDNIIITEGSCDELDTTPPTITIASNGVTSNSVTIIASGEDLESGINGYQFSKDNGISWTSKQTSNVYTFTGLVSSTLYTFKVKVNNNNGLDTTSESLLVTTSDNLAPTYSVNIIGWSQNKIVTITYPERQEGYVYEYSLDGATTWTEVASPATIKDLTFTNNGSIIARVTDGISEISSSNYNVTTIDIIPPSVAFSMNGNDEYAKDRGTTVNLSDAESDVAIDTLKYLWNTTTTPPSEGSFTSIFSDGEIVATPGGLTGDYYLWILAKDNAGNTAITRTNVFKLDNTKPIITLVRNSSIDISQGSAFNDPGATASDNISGDITSFVVVTGSVNTSVIGTYTLTYNVTDSVGNTANAVQRTINVIQPVPADNSGASAPVISSNMIPVRWNGSSWVKADINNYTGSNSWYDYSSKQWANAVTVTSATRGTYQNATVGTEVPLNDILTFFVWVPRYKYAIPSGSGPRQINVIFESKTSPKSSGSATGTSYLTHPAFTFGGTELNGLWVGKFETTGTINDITVKPNLTSVRNEYIGTMFNASRAMQNSGNMYGFPTTGIDTHMMKNTEWGVVAYLSHSIYGKNSEIWVNNNSNYTTGCGGSSVSAPDTTACNQYYTTNGQQASTTGNIYGIYDMSGGTPEYVMGNYNNQMSDSGFGSAPNSMYYNLYTSSVGFRGDATNADGTQGWYGDYFSFVDSSFPWFFRGGAFGHEAEAGIFNSYNYAGIPTTFTTFRVVVAPLL